ncbi:kinesin-like protein KIF16B isoform X7 [Salmo salar]|uniref:Kinesin-like protein KIF16B isoform X7 n=1 Tax=Salmo salar TaxID=8030 RepID=A0A1S3L720_SALSA|nr:kinesin-like protein KIF16B isoform X7 [Salmo salar]
MASVRVAVRLRPMNRREKDLTAKNIIEIKGDKTTITNLRIPDGITGDSMRERKKTFTYDFSYDSADSKSNTFVSQEKVFKDLGSDVLKAAFQGYNACIFAYGQTGSGKSYTMMGNPGDAGLIPRICEGLFSRIAGMTRWDEASFRTEVSYLEIYNERVRDLLRRKSTQTYNLRVREHPKDGPYVEDLSKHLVQNYHDVEVLMEAGNINRTTAATGMNDTSSRSHAIFTINFTQAKFDTEMPCETISQIHLVDLAGSERADATGATGVRLKEGGNINKSLVTLGNVISALADLSQDGVNTNLKKKQVFVPYRDSVLTWLLKDSLGGNSKTIMIATISPADVNYGETLSTLRYANRAKNIINKPTINEDCNVKLIRELRAEIARLKALLVQGNQIALLDSPTALSMEEKLHQNEARVLELTKEWTNKWNETQNILKEETLALRKEGIGVVLDSELPHLIGIDDDLLSTGIILYHLKEGRTYVGRDDASTVQDIVLHGLDLESEHCMFANQTGTVTLVPLNGAQCSVNGVQVTEASPLNQGAVILLGRTNMFRFNHPKEAAKLREKRKSGLLSSFSLSMTDLNKSCENLSTVMLYNPGVEQEIHKLKQRISKTEGSGRSHTGSCDEKTSLSTPPVSPIQSLPPVLPIADDGYSAFRKINAYIEEEVKRRLQKLNLFNGDKNIELSLSSESLQEDKEVNDSSSVTLTDEDDNKLQNPVDPRKLKYEKDSMPLLWRSYLYVPVLETSTLLEGHTTSSEEEGAKDHSELDKIGNPEGATKVLAQKGIMPYKEGEKAKWWQVGVKGKVDQAESENNGCDFKTKDWGFRTTNTIVSEDGSNSQCSPDEGVTNFSCNIVDKTKSLSYSQSRETRTENPVLHGLTQFDSVEATKVQNTSKTSNDTATVINSEVPILRQSSKRQIAIKGYFGLNKIPKGSVNGQVQRNLVTSEPDRLTNELGAKQSYVLGYLAGKLSGVYNDAGRYLQSTRDIIRQVRAGETSALTTTFSQYMTIVTKDLPFVQKKQLDPSMKPDSRQNKVHFANLTGNCLFNVPEKGHMSAITDISLWPKGSVTTYKDGKPVVYCQTLVQFPICLSELQSLPLQKILIRLYCVTPKIAATSHHLLGIYWLNVANCKQPTPQPSCLLLSETDLYAVSAGTGLGNNQPLAVFQHFSLSHIKEIQVSFAGQHVRLLGSTEDTIFVIFTHSKELTQELCCTLLKILAPAEVQEGPGAHPLLCGDLSCLSLDWRSHVPDLLLDCGLCVTSRFKRIMADLLYILHGNMEGPNKPSLADIHLLLYTSIKVENYSTSRQDVLCQFFLTDNHIGLVQEDAVFHPVPRGSTLVPIQPQFQGVELRRRSDIRCVLVRHSDRCMVLDIAFSTTHKGQIETKRKTRKGVAIVPLPSDCRPPADSWKLTFSSTSDAAILINHLST